MRRAACYGSPRSREADVLAPLGAPLMPMGSMSAFHVGDGRPTAKLQKFSEHNMDDITFAWVIRQSPLLARLDLEGWG